MEASVTVDVTLTTTPDWRARNCGITAWVMAITPKVLVSKTLRIWDIGVASKAPTTPIPALLTSTSIGPASSIAAAMLSRSVTSRAKTRNRSEFGRMSRCGRRIVAITFQPST
ncbi:hypothetical protein D9M72_506510 [compost metagenome]